MCAWCWLVCVTLVPELIELITSTFCELSDVGRSRALNNVLECYEVDCCRTSFIIGRLNKFKDALTECWQQFFNDPKFTYDVSLSFPVIPLKQLTCVKLRSSC